MVFISLGNYPEYSLLGGTIYNILHKQKYPTTARKCPTLASYFYLGQQSLLVVKVTRRDETVRRLEQIVNQQFKFHH